MEGEQFNKFFEIARLHGMSKKQASYFAAKALDCSPSEIAEITGSVPESVSRINSRIGAKLGYLHEDRRVKGRLIQQYGEALADPEIFDDFKTFMSGNIRDRIKVINEYAENKQIADMVRANPELLQAYQQMQQNEQG